MALKPDQERVKNLLTDTLTLLCKNGLTFNDELKVEALIGVTVDRDVFIVHVNEVFKNPDGQKSASPDLEASDEPPPGLREREKERNSTERRRQQAATSSGGRKPGQQQELFVDLTGRDTPGPFRSSPQRHGHPMPASPSARSSRAMPQPTTPTGRRGPYSSYGSPRTPTARGVQFPSGRFRSPMQFSPQMGSRGGRYISPQQIRVGGGFSPRQQQFDPMLQSPAARRSLNSALSQDNRHPQGTVMRQGPPVRARLKQNGEEVIVLDEPASRVQSPGRVLGSLTTTTPPAVDPTPLTIEPLTIEPSQSTSNSPPPLTSTTPPASSPTPPASSSPPASSTVPPASSPSTSPPPAVSSPDLTNRSSRSPMTSPPVLDETEEAIDDSLSRLASVIGDQQRARVAAGDSPAPGTPQSSIASPLCPSASSPGENPCVTPPPVAQSTIAALEEVAKSTVEELQKGVDAPPPLSTSNDDDTPPLSVASIQGNFDKYNDMGSGFKALKKPPPDDADVNEDQPPAKKRALSPGVGAEGPSADEEQSGNADSQNGELAKEVKAEQVEMEQQTHKKTDTLEVVTKHPIEGQLSTWEVRELLEANIVNPVLRKPEATVTSFRLVWRCNVSSAWQEIVPRRKELDDLVAKEKTISFFISSITGENAPVTTFPCVGYWVVTRHPDFNKMDFINRIQAASHGADLRMVLKEDGGTMDAFGGLCLMVKDHGEGVVQRHVAESAREAGLKGPKNAQTVRFVLKENFFEHLLKIAMKQLKPAAFTASLEKVVV